MFEFAKKYYIQYKLRKWREHMRNITVIDDIDGVILYSTENDPICITIKDPQFYSLVFDKGELGLGIAFVNGLWETNNLPSLFKSLCQNMSLFATETNSLYIPRRILMAFYKSPADDKKYIQHHYDIGNDFYQAMLEPRFMSYSVGFFENRDDTLERAMQNKLDFIISKMRIGAGDRVLDIGCGWGMIAKYIAQTTHCKKLTGITISNAQFKHCIEKALPTTTNLEFVETDYREHIVPNGYTKIYSIEMIEHVGKANYPLFFNIIADNLQQGGKALIQTSISTYEKDDKGCSGQTQFILNEIYPGGQIPKISWLIAAINEVPSLRLCSLEMIDGKQYSHVFKEWYKRFKDENNTTRELYPPEEMRGFEYFLASCVGLFYSNSLATCVLVVEKV